MAKSSGISLHDPTHGGKYCGGQTRNEETENEFCTRPAGWGTDHARDGKRPGTGRCKLHGGGSLRKSGRFSKIIRPRLAELIAEHEADPDPLNILPELAAARALFIDFIERYDEWRDAVLEWHASWSSFRRPIPEEMALSFAAVVDEYEHTMREGSTEENGGLTDKQEKDLVAARTLVKFLRGEDAPARPREILDVSAAMQHISVISQIVKREQDARSDNAISKKDLYRVQEAMAASVMKRLAVAIPDPQQLMAVLVNIQADWLEIQL